MNPNYIEFKKQRELGDVLTDTFAFLRSEFKTFFSTYFKIVGPFLAVMVISLVGYLYYAGNSFNLMIEDRWNEGTNLATVFVIALIYFCSIIAVYTMSQSTVLHYIKSYANGKGEIDFDTIKKEVYGSFWSFIGLGIMVGLSLGVGFMLCIIPGIYLYVPLILSFSIMVYNKMGASDAYSYSFKLIKEEWWITFATLFVIGIIIVVASYAFAIPSIIYQWLKMGIFSGEIDAESVMGVTKDPIYILLNVLNTVGQFLLNLISVIATVFIYFNLNEKKNFTGTYERIENLGKSLEE
ncbi:hypothetical protein J8L85_08575 [Maribacter sp. MMG018]|uniref:hypothetical protein n=1 Tax=Maribacter sp. MMG018 TaxID=2822688 RepID=UPI001B362345|nr:hypothetical protein [Maribacter sp. MMG018]MBQ4914487.1 hypothetical protein [Maribacter sp. MMG018]